jgi:AbrB family looped-hinge helix DNA binding protein
MSISKLSSKYQIVIPRSVRLQLGLKAGTKLLLHPLDKDRVILSKYSKSHTKALCGLGKDVWKSLGGTDSYIRKERSSWDKKK